MIKSDFHVHSVYCDGTDTINELAEKAIELGMDALGYSSHAYMPPYFEMDYPIKSREAELEYIAEVNQAKATYADKIDLFLGTECDYYSEMEKGKYDYVIGSVHHLIVGDQTFAIDHSEKITVDSVDKYYGGNYKNYVRDYYKLLSDVKNKTECDFVGHFDVVAKFNEGNKYFDESATWYLDYALECADALLKQNALFEINTGAIVRKLKADPYPNKNIFDYIVRNGGRFVINSDCHFKNNLTFGYDIAMKYYENSDAIIDFYDIVKNKK